MSDEQSFILVLIAFYLLECIKYAPPPATAFLSRWGNLSKWSPRNAFLHAHGIKKQLFIAPFLPWPNTCIVVTGNTEADHRKKRVRTLAGIRRWTCFLQRATRLLRFASCLTLLNFFLILPVLYSYYGDVFLVLYHLGFAYLFLFVASVHFFAVHKRLFPHLGTERFKSTLYLAFLPWHGMRAHDEIFLAASSSWSSLATYAAFADSPQSRSHLQRLWRQAHFLPKPPYSIDTLQSVFDTAKIDASQWLNFPKNFHAPQICPCCHSGYESTAHTCPECEHIPLHSVN